MERNPKRKHYIVVNLKTRVVYVAPFLDYQIALSAAKRLGPDWIVEVK